MPIITVLPSAVADQIAAGEVVERPASVVKELCENAVDAGAKSVDITILEGGRTLIRVSDDGCGMDADDAVLSLARHGPSKIRSADDLAFVSTFGFRGEALPAICSVAQLEIETALTDGAGTRVRAAGGERPSATPTQRRRGTTVTVANLFYNVPARAKFLRGARSEWRAISEVLTTLALTRRDIRIDATHDGRRALRALAAPSLRARLGALWGVPYAEDLLPVDDVSGSIHVLGLVERPANVGTATRRTFLAVNGRAIRDPGMIRAAELAYRSTIPAGTRPSLYLELIVPADGVDVNVHPAKAEVRFQDRWTIERAVERAVRQALGNFDSSAAFGRSFFVTSTQGAAQSVDRDVLHDGAATPPLFADASDGDASAVARTAQSQSYAPPGPRTVEQIPPLIQLRRTYIMFEHEGGVVLIDQHSAHERVLYELFLDNLENGGAPSQRLLLPITVTLTGVEIEAFELHRKYFDRLGFEVETFGGNTLIVHSVPAPHARFDAERCLRDTLASLTGDRVAGTAARHEHLVATIACKAAVKGGDVLSLDEMRALFAALRDTRLPAHDVHGRSTIVQLAWDEVDRRFGRA
ncbi:MAG: DNA mismatch repair endonuclease MutL [Gemmatimonadaceae bacterium]